MPRLFVAWRPPQEVRDALLAIMAGIEGARWQDDDQLHLTLRFIGELDERVADDVALALSGLRAVPVEARIEGVGSFDRKGRTESLHARVQPRNPLTALHNKIDGLLVRAGLEPERRTYLPHITLARFGRSGGRAEAWMAEHATLACAPFTVDHMALYESILGHEDARYELIERYDLGQSSGG